MLKRILLFTALAASLSFAADRWQIDTSHSSAQFSVRHLMVSNVRGEFSKVTGSVEYDKGNISALQINTEIDVASINTGDAKRDDHLKSPDFFDVAKFPKMTFQSTRAEKSGDGLKLYGDLTLHGVTKSVVLNVSEISGEVKDPWGNRRMGASATTTINRKDFGLNWNRALETGGVMVGEEVKITLDVELVAKSAS